MDISNLDFMDSSALHAILRRNVADGSRLRRNPWARRERLDAKALRAWQIEQVLNIHVILCEDGRGLLSEEDRTLGAVLVGMLRGDGSLGLHLEHFLQVLDEARVLLSERAFHEGSHEPHDPGQLHLDPTREARTVTLWIDAEREGGSHLAHLPWS